MSRLSVFVLIAIVAVAASVARADSPIALRVHYDRHKISREECARKAVEVMGVKEKFPFAEVTDDGNAQGWNDNIAIQVLSYATPDPERVFVVVIAAATDGIETDRLALAVRDHIIEGPDNLKTPAKIAPKDGTIPRRPVTLTCKSEERGLTAVLRHFPAAATIALEKKGAWTKVGGDFAMGFFPDRSALAFPAPTDGVHSARINVICATPSEESGEKMASDLLARIVKILYE